MPDRPSLPLPPYRGIFAVDAERFSHNPSARLPDLSATIQEVLRIAAETCGMPELWQQRRFPQSTGDGYLFGHYPDLVPYLVHPFLHSLHEALAEEDRRLRATHRELRLRLRVSINVGPVPDSGDEQRDRIGTPMNTTFRLLDCTALKNVLADSNPDITFLAAILSQRVFDDVVRGGYTPATHIDQFEPVTAEVPGKEFAEAAWIYVPRSSRRATSTNGAPGADAPTADEPKAPRGSRAYHNSGGGQQVNADQIHGGVSYGRRDA